MLLDLVENCKISTFDEWPLISDFFVFCVAYIRRGATPKMVEARKPSVFKGLRASLTIRAMRYIAAAYAAAGGCLPLGQWLSSAKTIAKQDYLRLPGVQSFIYEPAQLSAQVLSAYALGHVVLLRDHIYQV